jgi:hypothetical protein
VKVIFVTGPIPEPGDRLVVRDAGGAVREATFRPVAIEHEFERHGTHCSPMGGVFYPFYVCRKCGRAKSEGDALFSGDDITPVHHGFFYVAGDECSGNKDAIE